MRTIRRGVLGLAVLCCALATAPAVVFGGAAAINPAAPEPTALNRYFDIYTVFFDHRSTTAVVPPENGFETTLAYVIPRGSGAAGLLPVRSCASNLVPNQDYDYRLATGAGACEGPGEDLRVVSEEGDIFEFPPGGDTSWVPIYSCLSKADPSFDDIFESRFENCEGHTLIELLGYGLSYVPDSTAPVCSNFVIRRGAGDEPDQADVTVTDSGSGLLEITNSDIVNGSVTVPDFLPGALSGKTVTVTKATKGTLTRFSLDVTDIATNTTNCR